MLARLKFVIIEPMSLQVFIARHGQNEDNVNNLLNGHRDLPLTELGREQARELGRAIKASGLSFDTIYCSPLVRAKETAEILAEMNQFDPPIVYDQLIERDFGAMTGTPADEIEARCSPHIIKADPVTYVLYPEGGETFPQLLERGHVILDYVSSRHSDGNVLLVCHGDIGKMIYAAATGKDWRTVLTDFHFGNGDLIDISSDGDVHKVKLVQHNQ